MNSLIINTKLPNFRTLFPYYNNLKWYGAVASIVSNDTLIKKAKQAGLFFLTQQGDYAGLRHRVNYARRRGVDGVY